MDTPPHGLLITQEDGYPEGLLAVPNPHGSPRIIVPKSQVNALVLQYHEDIHHQSHIKVLHVLKALYYWPGMSAPAERLCTACQTCLTASVRRKHLKTTFDGYPGRVLCTQYRSTGHSTQTFFAPSEEIYGKELSFSIGGGCYE
jgi:hypothetical protein